jgi:hypothetical protein
VALSVQEANQLFDTWPGRTKVWYPARGHGYWLRARPKLDVAPCPLLKYPGTEDFTTEPDGLYVYLAQESFADVMCIEVCNNLQNLSDKRARFMPSTQSLLLRCRRPWLLESISVQHGGEHPRWEACGTFDSAPTSDITLPVRHLRILYALPAERYQECLEAEIAAPYEFYCRQDSLPTYNSPAFQEFLKRMSVRNQYRTVRERHDYT